MKLSIVLSLQPTGFSALTFQGETEGHLRKIKALGYDGAELAIRDPSLLDWNQLEGWIRAYELIVPALGTGQAYFEEGLSFCHSSPTIRKQAIERIKSHILLAGRFGAGVIIGLIRGKVEKPDHFQTGYDRMIESLRECSGEAEQKGISLWIEPLNRYETNLINTMEEGKHVIDRVRSRALGLLPDTFHMNIEERSIEESLRTHAASIRHVHFADSNRWPPGQGHLDFKSILKVLGDVGYKGFVSMENLPKPDPDQAARLGIEYLGNLIRGDEG